MLIASWLESSTLRRQRPFRHLPWRARVRRAAKPAFCIERLEDRTVLSTFTVTNTFDDGRTGSLRWALDQATADPYSTIDFAIPASDQGHLYYRDNHAPGVSLEDAVPAVDKNGNPVSNDADLLNSAIMGDGMTADPDYSSSWWSIRSQSGLSMGEGTTIDGYSQPGSSPNCLADGDNATLRIELDGSQDPELAGLLSLGSHGTVKGLVVNRFSTSQPGAASALFPFDPAGSTSNRITGNFIGTDVSGTKAFDTNTFGILTQTDSNDFIGIDPSSQRPDYGQRNIISGNGGYGIAAGANGGTVTNLTIAGNFIGTDRCGGPLGNGVSGIVIYSIPGYPDSTSASATDVSIVDNTIAYNHGAGVWLTASVYFAPEIQSVLSGTVIRRNSIHDNGGLGIDIGGVVGNTDTPATIEQAPYGPDGVTLNDTKGHDGPNAWQDFPILTAASTSATSTTISGRLGSVPNTTFSIDFYGNANPGHQDLNDARDPNLYGEGQTWLGSCQVTTDVSGNVVSSPDGSAVIGLDSDGRPTFTATLRGAVPAGMGYFTATATNESTGDTSELSADVLPVHLSNPNSSGALQVSLTATFGDPAGIETSYTVDWGDGSTGTVSPFPANGGALALSHTYQADGNHLVKVFATDSAGHTGPAASALFVDSTSTGDAITVSGGPIPGEVYVTTGLNPQTPYWPTDLVFVAGAGGGDSYTVNFGSALTTPITVSGGGSSSSDTLIVNGDPSLTNVINKTPGRITWGAPVAETIHRSGIPNTVINANGTSHNYINDPGGNTIINGGPGTNTITVTATTGSGVVINGGPGTNTYVIDLGSLAGPVSVQNSNAGPSDTLVVNGAAGNNTITAAGNQVTSGAQAITVAAPLASLTVNGGSGTNQVTVSSLSVPVQALAINGGGTSNTVTLNNVGSSVASVAITPGSSTGTTQVQVQGSLPATVTAQDLLPVVNAGSGATINEGSLFTRSGRIIDPNPSATLSATVNYGDGTAPQALALGTGASFALSHVYGRGGSFTVTVTVRDGHNGIGTGSFVVTVPNMAPTIGSFNGTSLVIPGQTVAVAAGFSDAGFLETHTAALNWGDNTSSAGTVAEANGSGTVAGSHVYAATGTYTVTVTVTDSAGAVSGPATFRVTVTQSALLLDSTASGALTISGNGSINLPGLLVVDSSSNSALTASGNATVRAASIQVVGKVQKSGNASLSPAPVTGVAVVANPLASLTGPSTSGLTNFGSVSISGNTTRTLYQGIYTQISIAGNAVVTFAPGLYLIEGGGITVSGNARVSGQGVTLYNTSSNYPNTTGSYGGITFSGNGSINLTAPATGPYVGIVVFQPSANTRALSLSGNATGLAGTLYAPSAQLVLSGNAQLNAALVVDQLSISGNSVSTQVADGAAGSGLDTAGGGTLLAGELDVYVNDPSGAITADERARLDEAIAGLDALLAPYSVQIILVSDPILANVVLDTGTTSAAGTAADGVLGSYSSTGEITLLEGWNWYAGADPAQIGADQYDFQTVVTHELGHALGLGHSPDATSVMYESLASGVTRRTLTVADLNIPEPPQGADAERAALVPAREVLSRPSVFSSSPGAAESQGLAEWAERWLPTAPGAGEPVSNGLQRALVLPHGLAAVRYSFPFVRADADEQGYVMESEAWDADSFASLFAPLPVDSVRAGVSRAALAVSDQRAAVVTGLVQERAIRAEALRGNAGVARQTPAVGNSAQTTTRDGADRYFALVFIAAVLAARREPRPAEEPSKSIARLTQR